MVIVIIDSIVILFTYFSVISMKKNKKQNLVFDKNTAQIVNDAKKVLSLHQFIGQYAT